MGNSAGLLSKARALRASSMTQSFFGWSSSVWKSARWQAKPRACQLTCGPVGLECVFDVECIVQELNFRRPLSHAHGQWTAGRGHPVGLVSGVHNATNIEFFRGKC